MDVTGLRLVDVVDKVRCEAKEAIQHLDPQRRFDRAIMTYQFDFVITEDNDASADAKFTVPVSHGTFLYRL